MWRFYAPLRTAWVSRLAYGGVLQEQTLRLRDDLGSSLLQTQHTLRDGMFEVSHRLSQVCLPETVAIVRVGHVRV